MSLYDDMKRTHGWVSRDAVADGVTHDEEGKLIIALAQTPLAKFNSDGQLDFSALEERIKTLEAALARTQS